MAHARITFGSRVTRVDRVGDFRRLAPVDRRSPVAARPAFQYLSNTLDNAARFRLDRSSSRHSPSQPSRTVSTASDPSRSSTRTSTVVFAITAFHESRPTLSAGATRLNRSCKCSRTVRRLDRCHTNHRVACHGLRLDDRRAGTVIWMRVRRASASPDDAEPGTEQRDGTSSSSAAAWRPNGIAIAGAVVGCSGCVGWRERRRCRSLVALLPAGLSRTRAVAAWAQFGVGSTISSLVRFVSWRRSIRSFGTTTLIPTMTIGSAPRRR